MKDKQNEVLLQVAERYLFHSGYQTEDPYLAGICRKQKGKQQFTSGRQRRWIYEYSRWHR